MAPFAARPPRPSPTRPARRRESGRRSPTVTSAAGAACPPRRSWSASAAGTCWSGATAAGRPAASDPDKPSVILPKGEHNGRGILGEPVQSQLMKAGAGVRGLTPRQLGQRLVVEQFPEPVCGQQERSPGQGRTRITSAPAASATPYSGPSTATASQLGPRRPGTLTHATRGAIGSIQSKTAPLPLANRLGAISPRGASAGAPSRADCDLLTVTRRRPSGGCPLPPWRKGDLAPGSGCLAGRDPQQRRGGHRQHHPGGRIGEPSSGRHSRVQDPDDGR